MFEMRHCQRMTPQGDTPDYRGKQEASYEDGEEMCHHNRVTTTAHYNYYFI